MTRQDAEYLEHSTYVDYSEPKISFITGKLIDDKKVIAEHWLLKPQNTFQCVDNELYLRGKDEMGKDLTICFDAFNFLEWIDKEQIDYIKQKVIEYVEKK